MRRDVDLRPVVWACRALVLLLAFVSTIPAPLLIAMWALVPAFVVSVGERDMWDDGRAVEWGQMHDALKRATRGRTGR